MNGIFNGMQDQQAVQMLNQQAVVGVVQQNLIPVCKYFNIHYLIFMTKNIVVQGIALKEFYVSQFFRMLSKISCIKMNNSRD